MEKKLAMLRASNDLDAGRELLFLHDDCQWRSTREAILRELHRFPQPRVLEFLMRVALAQDDLPMCEAAVWSLGRSGAPMASRFLTHFFGACTAAVKPGVIVALGALGDRTLVDELMGLLPKAIKEQQHLLVKNTVLTLAELKVVEAVPYLEDMASKATDPQVALSALLALGKVSRDTAWFETNERLFSADLFRSQIFSTARAQVQLRAQWKLEDYLGKLFSEESILPELPRELATFARDDVFEGIGMFTEPVHFERLCYVLARCPGPDAAGRYTSFFGAKAHSPEHARLILESMAAHSSADFRTLLFELQPAKTDDPSLWTAWLATLSLSLPDALGEFDALVAREDVPLAVSAVGIAFVNGLVDAALALQSKPKKTKAALKTLDRLLDECTDAGVQGRVLRGYGQLRQATVKAIAFVRSQLGSEKHRASCLFFLERAGGDDILDLTLGLVTDLKPQSTYARGLFKVLASCDVPVPADHVAFEKAALLLGKGTGSAASATGDGQDKEVTAAVLGFLARHPSTRLAGAVGAALKSNDENVLLPAILAAKALGNEEFADDLAGRLGMPAGTAATLAAPSAPSITVSGRALDALLFLRGNRPKRLVFDFLEKNLDDAIVCEKIIRDLKPPQDAGTYFVERLDAILAARPLHTLRDGFIQLRQNFVSGPARKGTKTGSASLSAAQISEMDEGIKVRFADFPRLDEEVKAALRAAEAPFLQPEIFNGVVDKSISILEYAKALDLVLEGELGRAILFPCLQRSLAQFQNLVHAVGLNEDYPAPARVLRNLGLERWFSPESLPVHKMAMLCKSVLNGKILYEQWKVFDGLRAWAVVFILFCRAPSVELLGQGRPQALVPLKNASEAAIVDFAKRLIQLQELRNPAAHRKTHLDFAAIDEVRQEVFVLLSLWRSFR